MISFIGDNGHHSGFTNCAPSTKCITKLDETITDGVEDLNLVIPMYNLLDINSNYSDTRVILWFYSNDESNNFNADISCNNNNNFKSFHYKTKLLKNTIADCKISEKCNNFRTIKKSK